MTREEDVGGCQNCGAMLNHCPHIPVFVSPYYNDENVMLLSIWSDDDTLSNRVVKE
jgi:hypothetical protein